MLNSNSPSMELCKTPKIISNHELYMPFNFTLCFCAVVIKKGYLPHKLEVQWLTVHEVNNRRLWKGQLVIIRAKSSLNFLTTFFCFVTTLTLSKRDILSSLRVLSLKFGLIVCQNILFNYSLHIEDIVEILLGSLAQRYLCVLKAIPALIYFHTY